MKTKSFIRRFSLFVGIGILILQYVGCAGSSNNAATTLPSYPIDSTVATTLERTIVPVPASAHKVLPNDVADFALYGYGFWKYQAGISYVRLDLTPSGSAVVPQSGTGVASLLRFFTMTDIHLTDVQSPAQVLFFGLGRIPGQAANNASYSPVIPYSTQVLDAAVQTVNALHKKQAFDFGMFLGDAINLGQYNELRWYIDILDGKIINPNSDPMSQASTEFYAPVQGGRT